MLRIMCASEAEQPMCLSEENNFDGPIFQIAGREGKKLRRLQDGRRRLNWLSNVYPIGCGHIDEMARFVSPDTIALAEVSPEDRDRDPGRGSIGWRGLRYPG